MTVDITGGVSLRIAWSLLWRLLLVGTLPAIILGAIAGGIAGFVVGYLGHPEWGMLAGGIISIPINLVVYPFAIWGSMHWLLCSRLGNYKLVVTRAA